MTINRSPLCGGGCVCSHEPPAPIPITVITHDPMSEVTVRYALKHIREALSIPDARIPYTIVGGCALWALGSTRETSDIDILVMDNDEKEARKMLIGVADGFGVTNANNLFFRHLAEVDDATILTSSLQRKLRSRDFRPNSPDNMSPSHELRVFRAWLR